MEGSYGLNFGQEAVGQVRVERQGLYYIIDCKCSRFTDQMYDLTVTWGEQQLRLGLLAPLGSGLALHKKLPVKDMGQGRPVFGLRPRHQAMPEGFVPLHPQEPFAYLRRLENAYLAVHNGQLGIAFQTEGKMSLGD